MDGQCDNYLLKFITSHLIDEFMLMIYQYSHLTLEESIRIVHYSL